MKRIVITENQMYGLGEHIRLGKVNFKIEKPERYLKYDIDKIDGGNQEIKEMLSSLTKKELDEVFVNYKYLFKSPTYDNPITMFIYRKTIDEGLIHTYPIEKTFEYVKDYFDFQDWQIKILKTSNGNKYIRVYIPNTEDNLNELDKAMNLCGYFLAYPKKEVLKGLDNGTIIWLDYDGKFQDDESEKIRSEEKFLFHLTPRYYRKKIETIGISPKSKNAVFNYPNRVYFLRGTTPKNDFFDLAQKISANNRSYMNTQEKYKGKYTLFMIDVERLPNNVRLYTDPRFNYGVYTTSYIDPKCIVDVKDVELD